ncbi:MAG TPA: alanine racemase, partial [Steroidobacteraceae bacterium]|nr:alanine racemase [Steroidobacteraceae bacterium]
MRDYAPGCRVAAVVKANAYGHGLVTVAGALAGADAFGVARIEEATSLRKAGCRARVLLLEGVRDRADLEVAAREEFEPFLHQAWQLDLLEAWRGAGALRAWLKVDTGMHRLGFGPAEAADAARRLAACRALQQPAGLATHLAASEDPDRAATEAQLAAFAAATAGLPGERSIANSAALIAWPESRADWV